jgi:hypothetical protein
VPPSFSCQICLIAIAVAAEEVKNNTEFEKKPQKRGNLRVGYVGVSTGSGHGGINRGPGAVGTGHGEILNIAGFGHEKVGLNLASIGRGNSVLNSGGYGNGGNLHILAGNSGVGVLGHGFGNHGDNAIRGSGGIISYTQGFSTGKHEGLVTSGGYLL